MERILLTSLPNLANEIEFQVEKVSGADLYYTDGMVMGSILKLILHRKDHCVTLYFFSSGDYLCMGQLTEEETSILNGFVATLKSKKLNESSPTHKASETSR
jgi:hypothetical protein